MTPAGSDWCKLFPTSVSLGDLIEPFQSNVRRFISALETGGATVSIAATYRPPERAYLMHWCCMIAEAKQDPDCIAPMEGVDIDWNCGNPDATRVAAVDMMRGYDIRFPAALVSRHTQRRAIDMTITGFHLTGQPLYDMGATFGVHKLIDDAPHWSDDGH